MASKRLLFILLVIVGLFSIAVFVGKSHTSPMVIIVSMMATTISVSTPLVLGALSGVFCEKAGVVNIGIEGMMLISAFFGWLGAIYANSVFGMNAMPSILLGVFFAIVAGGLFGLLHAVLSVTFRINQIIAGTVINILAIGISGFLNRQLFFEHNSIFGGNVPHAPGVLPRLVVPGLTDIPVFGQLFNLQPIAISAIVLVIFSHILFKYTRWGLRTRAVGEHPRAADTSSTPCFRPSGPRRRRDTNPS